MKRTMYLLTLLIGLGLIFTSCQKNISEVVDDETELEQIVNDENSDFEDYLMDYGIDDESEDNLFGFSREGSPFGFNKVMEPINNVFRFGRVITERYARRIVFEQTPAHPDTARLYMERVLMGRFVIVEKFDSNDTTNADTVAIYRKPLKHVVRRRALFAKRANDNRPRARGWRLIAISPGQGNSPGATVRIAKVVVIPENGDSLVFDSPLRPMMSVPDGLPIFDRGETVTVRVLVENTSDNPVINPRTNSTELVMLHYARRRGNHHRKLFEFVGTDPETGLNVYEGTWQVQERGPRVYHAIVDVIDSGTIFDSDADAYPYNSATWSCPYIVR